MPTFHLSRMRQRQEGASLTEYALLAFLIASFCVLAITAVGENTLALYMAVCNGVATATGQAPC